MLFQTTARSSRACTVFLTQNLPNYYSEFGGDASSKAKADSLLGNLGTKIFHANGDPETNGWASEVVAEDIQYRSNVSSSKRERFGVDAGGRHITMSSHQELQPDIFPQEFTHFRKGGPENNLKTDALLFQTGRRWKTTGKNHLRVTFRQDIN